MDATLWLLSHKLPLTTQKEATKQDSFEETDDILVEIGNNQEIILLGEFTSRTGSKMKNNIVGPFGEDTVNDNMHRLIHLCGTHDLRINNGFYKHKNIHRYTWIKNSRKSRSIIDYIIRNQSSALEWNEVREK